MQEIPPATRRTSLAPDGVKCESSKVTIIPRPSPVRVRHPSALHIALYAETYSIPNC